MATRPPTTDPFTCVTCEIEIAGRPTFHVGLAFCCAGCVADGPCICSYDSDVAEDEIRECLDVESVLDARHPTGDWILDRAPSRRDRKVLAGR